MTAICQLCGIVVRADNAPMIITPPPGIDADGAKVVLEISLFDKLAGRMTQHLEQHEFQNGEMVAVMFLAAKMYAMTFAESSEDEPEYSALRDAWRTGILQMLQTTTKPVPVFDAGQEPAAGEPANGSGVVESNEQKSARKVSS